MKLALRLPGNYEINPVNTMPSGGFSTVQDIFTALIQFLLVGIIVGALLFLIWGGIQWITSGGDKSGVDAARKKIVYAVVGLVVAFLSFFIISFIGNFFGVKLIDTPESPSKARCNRLQKGICTDKKKSCQRARDGNGWECRCKRGAAGCAD